MRWLIRVVHQSCPRNVFWVESRWGRRRSRRDVDNFKVARFFLTKETAERHAVECVFSRDAEEQAAGVEFVPTTYRDAERLTLVAWVNNGKQDLREAKAALRMARGHLKGRLADLSHFDKKYRRA